MSPATRTLMATLIRHGYGMLKALEQWIDQEARVSEGARHEGSHGLTR